MHIEIRALTKEDYRKDFSCGNYELDIFFQKFASQNQFKHYIGLTYVALLNHKIVAFATISASSIRVEKLPTQYIKKLPNYPLPVLRISRLAVDTTYQNKGIAKSLLKFILNLSIEQKNKFGCMGIIVDAKEDSVSYYEQFDFETINIIQGQLDVRPYAKTMFLSMHTIMKAINNSSQNHKGTSKNS